MIEFALQKAAAIVGGRLAMEAGQTRVFTGMSHDTRQLETGNLFCALVGQRVDGHDLIGRAVERGAAAALVTSDVAASVATIRVDDVTRAMGALARAWRDQCDPRVIGITGSNGKTTVKTMLATIVARVGKTCATRGNCNNELGVPLTLARLAADDRYAVVEMGCGQPGDIAYLAGIVRPDVAVVTNAGPAHLERLGSIEGVARTKGELFEALAADGIAIINRDDDYYDYWCARIGDRRRISFGRHPEADVRLVERGGGEWVATPAGEFELVLHLPGEHNRLNALAATAAALALDIDLDVVAAALADVQSLAGRLESRSMPGGWTLIDDSYNANPGSLYAALQVLATRPRPRWLVLGNMAELGRDSAKLHREIGHNVRDLGVERLFVIGDHARDVADAFGSGAEVFTDHDALADRLLDSLEPGLTCLVKGSRSAHMEQVIERLGRGEAAPC